MQLIIKDHYKQMPWKNGQGTTGQIQIYPNSSEFPGDKFLWRLSTASIQASGPFSVFPGCDRLLVIVKGAGINLNASILEPLSPLHFSGEFQVQCQLLEGEVVDLGLIYRRSKVRAEMSVVDKITLDKATTNMIYCVSGALNIKGLKMAAGDCLRIEGEKEFILEKASSESLKLIHVKIYLK